MALKKPSVFFAENNNHQVTFSSGIQVQEIPEKFDVYKSNVKNIEVLNEFTEVFGSFKDNVAKIQEIETTVEQLKEEVSNSLSKEDLDNAMLSNLVLLEDNIEKIQLSLKGINRKDLSKIYEEVEDITNKVSYVFEEELPKYKSFIKNSEISFDKRLLSYQQTVEEKLGQFIENFDDQFQIKFKTLENELEGINENALQDISSNFTDLAGLVNQELPKYKKQITDNSIKTEEKINSVYEFIKDHQKEVDERVNNVQKSLTHLIENEVPKYQELLVNAKIQNDEKIENLTNEFVEKINSLVESTQNLNQQVDQKTSSIEVSFQDKVSNLENYILSTKNEIEETSSTYKKLYKAIEAKGLADKNKFEEQKEFIESVSKEIESAYKKIESVREEVEKISQEELKNKIDHLQELFTKKLNLLENDIEHKNNKIKEVNSTLSNDIFALKEHIKDISAQEIDKKYNHIAQKISYIEEVFENFNEKTILNEGLLNEPPNVKNTDPLTPLDKNYVTLEQLQEHYRLFINRIQQQLATIGGGGETRLEFLDDIDRDSAKVNGKFLKYDSASGKWIGASAGGGGGSQTLDDTLNLGNTSSLGMSVGILTATSGNFSGIITSSGANITGIVTATDFNSASDIKLKNNVNTIDNPLDKIVKLNGVNFEWKETGKKSLGVIAQEVEKVLPELVSGEESKTVNYNGLIGLLIECVKEQQKEIEELKRLINK